MQMRGMTLKAEERSLIQIKTGAIWNPHQTSQLIHDSLPFQNPRIRSIYRKNPQSVRFLRSNPSIQKPILPLLQKLAFLIRLRRHHETFGPELAIAFKSIPFFKHYNFHISAWKFLG